MAGIKYDTGGSAVMTKAIDELINRVPGWTEEEEVVMKRSGHVNAQEEIAEIVSC